jgi:hypothetical protein
VANAHDIARKCGLVLVSGKRRHPGTARLPPRHCYSRATIKWVHDRGEAWGLHDHVYDMLALIREADDTMLFGDVIKGVSRWGTRWRVTTGQMGHILPAFRLIDLYGIRAAVLHHKIEDRDAQIAFLVSGAMEPCMRGLA